MSQAGVATRRRTTGNISSLERGRALRSQREDLELKFTQLQQEHAELHAEIFEAGQVHRRLCAPRLVRRNEFEIASEIFAVRHLAGDFFTTREMNNGVLLALGDISGKGLAAGMWITHLVSLVGARAAVHSEPDVIVAGVNRDVCLTQSTVPLASLFVARLDPSTGKFEYCSAGHPPALLLRADGKVETLTEGGLLLGVLPNAPYVRGSIHLEHGDVLLAYSDGVLETLNNSDEEFGLSRIEAQLRNAALVRNDVRGKNSAETILFSILAAVQDFAVSHPLVDDLSAVVIKRD